MAKKDYYDVLGVERGADEKAIKRAYKKLAMQYHPDRTKGDKAKEEKFKEIQEAYEILGDKEKRAAYDQYGHAPLNKAAWEAVASVADSAVLISVIFLVICSAISSAVVDVVVSA